ncbi:MAG: RNA polymerase sigma factor [Phycisphaerales bacterium]
MPTILQQLSAGDRVAVARCLDEYGGLVWSIASRYLGGDRAEIEDAVQDVFISLWLAAGRFDPSRGSEAAFVATIARRRIVDARRRMVARSPHRFLDRARQANAEAPSIVEMRELGDDFANLPPEERLALWFAVSRGMSHREIALATEVPVGTVKSRLRRAVIRLQRALVPGELREPKQSAVDGNADAGTTSLREGRP